MLCNPITAVSLISWPLWSKPTNRWDVDDVTSCVVRRYKNQIQKCVATRWRNSDLTETMFIGNIIHHSRPIGASAIGSEFEVTHYYNPLVNSNEVIKGMTHLIGVTYGALYTVTTNFWLTPSPITTAHMLKVSFGVFNTSVAKRIYQTKTI